MHLEQVGRALSHFFLRVLHRIQTLEVGVFDLCASPTAPFIVENGCSKSLYSFFRITGIPLPRNRELAVYEVDRCIFTADKPLARFRRDRRRRSGSRGERVQKSAQVFRYILHMADNAKQLQSNIFSTIKPCDVSSDTDTYDALLL